MENNFLNKEEVAKMLTVTTRTIDNWIEKRNFPCIKITDRKRLFCREEVLRWIENRK